LLFGVLCVRLARLTEVAARMKLAAEDTAVEAAIKEGTKEDNNTHLEAVPTTKDRAPQLTIRLQGLGCTNTGRIFLPSLLTFSTQKYGLIWRWKAYFEWDMGNPPEFEDKDHSIFTSQVQNVYRKAVIQMRYYPETCMSLSVFFNPLATYQCRFLAHPCTILIGKNDDALALSTCLASQFFDFTNLYAQLRADICLRRDV
jgi:hypothetical protein